MQVILTLIMMMSSPAPSPIPDIDLAQIAVDSCKKIRQKNKHSALVIAREMLAIEKSMGIPEQFWGMSLAAACLESGFNPKAKGDKRGKKYKAIGILQLWPWYRRAYGTVRTEVSSSTRSWLQHIIRMVPKVKKQCRYKSVEKIWVAAWVTGVRSKKTGGRCKERPLHYRQLKKIRKAIDKQRQRYRTRGK